MKGLVLPEDWEIEAAVPEYVDGQGDCTRLLLTDGTERLLPVRLRTLLERLARRHCQSLPLLRAWARERTALCQTAPLAMGAELVLVPFRARRPRFKGDGAMGVVNAAHVRLRQTQDRATLELSSGRSLAALWGTATLAARLRAAQLLRQELEVGAEASVLRRLFWRKVWESGGRGQGSWEGTK